MAKIIVVGSGFSGLSAACHLAKAGHEVTVLEKNEMPGGRARKFTEQGFSFDMGPSWYWMPEVFESFFAQFGKKVSDYYALTRLDPSYRVFWTDGVTDVPADMDALKATFEKFEPGAAKALDRFLKEAEYKYRLGIGKLVYKPGLSLLELLDLRVILGVFKLDVFSNMAKHIRKIFRHPKIVQLLEFPVLFLGAQAKDTPALYSLMNYADLVGGTWYPDKGMYAIVEAMYDLARELSVKFHFNKEVEEYTVLHDRIENVRCKDGEVFQADVVLHAADYHHAESLLPARYRNYSETYWESRKMAPSCLLYYLGLDTRLSGLLHHNLFFDADFEQHASDIYVDRRYPEDPLFYLSLSSKTDANVAPEGCENLVLLIPVAAGLENDTPELRQAYLDKCLRRMELRTGQEIARHIVFQRSFAVSDFTKEYNSFKGNAYGLANTLLQTANLKPKIKNRHISNLFYAGQLTVPGPGVPPSIISGEIVANHISAQLK